MNSRPLERDLVHLLGRGAVSSDEADLRRYGGDALGTFRAFRASGRLNDRASAVIWPRTSGDISKSLAYASRQSIPVVPYGGGTGVMGAATPLDSAIILNLRRMNRVIGVDKESRTATFQSGILLEDAHRALTAHELRLGHDPWSRPIATLGGAISTNGVGYTASGHGAMGDQILGMMAALGGGEVVESRAVPGSFFGATLNHLFIGTEGTFGIICEATVKAFPIPICRSMICFDFPEFDSGYEAISAIYANGLIPTVMDYGDELVPGGSGRRDTATLYLVFEGGKESVEANVGEATAICLRHDGRRGSDAAVNRYWIDRHASAHRYKEDVLDNERPDLARRSRSAYRMDYLHVALPAGKVLEYRRKCEALLSKERVSVREWSVWGRPEFFSLLISPSVEVEGDEDRLAQTVDRVLQAAQAMGGAMEYCHGVGVKLTHLLPREMGVGFEVARAIKRTLDPHDIMNPGKLF